MLTKVSYSMIDGGVLNAVDYGADPTGVADSTAQLQTALTASVGKALLIDGTFKVTCPNSDASDQIVLAIPSNTHIVFTPGSSITLNPTTSGRYKILSMRDVDNVVIDGNGAVITGDRVTPAGVTTYDGFGHGLNIEGSSNIFITDLKVEDCWGDGVYIGKSATGGATFSENILLSRIVSDNNRRQGMSIVSVKNFADYSGLYTNTNGTSPEAGIDVEPDAANEFLENLSFNNTVCKNNAGAGFLLFLNAMSDTTKNITISYNQCVSENNANKTYSTQPPGGFTVDALKDVGVTNYPTGKVSFNNCASKNDNYLGFSVRNKTSLALPIELNSPSVINNNTKLSNTLRFNAAIAVLSDDASTRSTTPGWVYINNPIIIDPNGNLNAADRAQIIYYSLPSFGGNIDKVFIKDPTFTETSDPVGGGRYYDGSNDVLLVLTDDYKKPELDMGSADFTALPRRFGQILTNQSQIGGVRLCTLPTAAQVGIGCQFEFLCKASQIFRIDPAGSDLILTGTGAGKYIQTNTIGSRLVLKKYSATEWLIVEQTGTWAFEP